MQSDRWATDGVVYSPFGEPSFISLRHTNLRKWPRRPPEDR